MYLLSKNTFSWKTLILFFSLSEKFIFVFKIQIHYFAFLLSICFVSKCLLNHKPWLKIILDEILKTDLLKNKLKFETLKSLSNINIYGSIKTYP